MSFGSLRHPAPTGKQADESRLEALTLKGY